MKLSMSGADFPADLDLVVSRTGHDRYRELTDPDHPDYHPGYVAIVQQEAARLRTEPEPALPGVVRQAVNAATAVGRALAATASGAPVLASPAVRVARLAVCRNGAGLASQQITAGHCDQLRPSDDRCAACGCYLGGVAGKAALATEDCPLRRWPGC